MRIDSSQQRAIFLKYTVSVHGYHLTILRFSLTIIECESHGSGLTYTRVLLIVYGKSTVLKQVKLWSNVFKHINSNHEEIPEFSDCFRREFVNMS